MASNTVRGGKIMMDVAAELIGADGATVATTANPVPVSAGGTAAHDAAVSGNPTRIAGRARTPGSPYTAVAVDDTADIVTDLTGRQVVRGVGGTTANASTRTITTGGTAQNAFAANTARVYLFVQNPPDATEDLYVNDTGAAVADTTSWRLRPGDALEFAMGFIPVAAISVIAATTAHAFFAKEA